VTGRYADKASAHRSTLDRSLLAQCRNAHTSTTWVLSSTRRTELYNRAVGKPNACTTVTQRSERRYGKHISMEYTLTYKIHRQFQTVMSILMWILHRTRIGLSHPPRSTWPWPSKASSCSILLLEVQVKVIVLLVYGRR